MAEDLGSVYTDKKIRNLERLLRRVYKQAGEDIKKKTEAFFSEVAKHEESLLKKVAGGDMTQEAFDEWKNRAVFTGKNWQAQQENIAKVLSDTNGRVNALIRGEQLNAFAFNANYTAYQFEHGFGVNFGFDLYNQDAVAKLLKDKPNILPFKKLDKKKDERWNFKNIRSQIAQGIIQGESIPKIAKRLSESVPNRNEKQMVIHARTAMTSAQNAARQERFEEAEELGIKFKKVWLATLDNRTREAHAELDGQAVKPDEDFEVDGEKIAFPGDPHADPSLVYNCRCTMVTELDDYPSSFTRRVQEDGSVIEDQTYQEWEASKAEAETTGEQADGDNGTATESKSAYDIIGERLRRPRRADFDDPEEFAEARERYKQEKEAQQERAEEWYQENVNHNPMSVDELREWCDKNNCAIYGSLEGLDGEALRNYTERFEQLSKDFPIVQEYHDRIGVPFEISYTPDRAYDAEASHGIAFGGTYSNYHDTIMSNVSDVYLVRGKNPAVKTFDHEFGHQVFDAMKYGHDKDIMNSTLEETRRRIQMEDDLKKNVFGKPGMSEYAETNAHELFAEGFCAWYGGEQTEFAKAFGSFIKRWL